MPKNGQNDQKNNDKVWRCIDKQISLEVEASTVVLVKCVYSRNNLTSGELIKTKQILVKRTGY